VASPAKVLQHTPGPLDEDFGQRLQDGLSTIHPDMPTFHFDQHDAEAAVSYLRTIQERKK
jgi:hypothetical protein